VLSERTSELSTAEGAPVAEPDTGSDTAQVEAAPSSRPGRATAAPAGRTSRRGRADRMPAPPPPRASRVVVRAVDPWSVLKVSLLFYLSVFVILLVASMLLWAAANSIGVVENIESFMDSIGFTDFTFEAGQLLRASALGGGVLVVAGTFGNVVMAVLYNLISEVVGGLRVTLGEDESARRSR
jgi:hypothetical protein